MSGPSISAWFTGDDGPESHRPRSDGADLTIGERFGGSETPPAESCECGQTHTDAPLPRTSPVTPAERACATVLRAYLAWQLSEDDVAPQVMVDLGASLRTEGLIAGYRAVLTPAGRDLLARVEAAERTPETVLRAMLRAYEACFLHLGAAWTAATVQTERLRAVALGVRRLRFVVGTGIREEAELRGELSSVFADYQARLAGTIPIDAPPRKEPSR